MLYHLRDTTSVKQSNEGNDIIQVQIEDIDYNEGVVTLDEKILTSLHNRMKERFPEEGENMTPMLYNPDRLEMTHYLTVDQLWEAISESKGPWEDIKLTKTQYEVAKKFSKEFEIDFYGTFEELQDLAEDEQIAITNVAYDEAKWNTTVK